MRAASLKRSTYNCNKYNNITMQWKERLRTSHLFVVFFSWTKAPFFYRQSMKYLDLNSCSFFHQLHELVITNEAVLCCCCGGDLVHQVVQLPYRAVNKPSRSLWVFLIILNYKSVSRGFLQGSLQTEKLREGSLTDLLPSGHVHLAGQTLHHVAQMIHR